MTSVGSRLRGGGDEQLNGMKFQAPTSKLQRSSNLQAPEEVGDTHRSYIFSNFYQPTSGLEFGAWTFSGTWSLELGAFQCSHPCRRLQT